jgi:hypothetical protein
MWCNCRERTCRAHTARSGTPLYTWWCCCSLSPPGRSRSLCSLKKSYDLNY